MIPEATGYDYAFDGVYAYQVAGVSSLTGLDGRKRKGKLKRFFKRVGKGVKKVSKKAFKVVKKVLPVVNTVLTFVPGVGWAAKAALTAAEMGIKYAEKKRAKKDVQTPVRNSSQTRVATSSLNPERHVKKIRRATTPRNSSSTTPILSDTGRSIINKHSQNVSTSTTNVAKLLEQQQKIVTAKKKQQKQQIEAYTNSEIQKLPSSQTVAENTKSAMAAVRADILSSVSQLFN